MAGSLTARLDKAVLRALDRLAEETRRCRACHLSQAIQD
jgi:predicted transcriptional regulator